MTSLNGPLTPADRDSPTVLHGQAGSLQEQADADQAAYHDAMERREQHAGEEAFVAAAGERVEVTWGDELFQPVKFNGIRVGPFTASTIVRPGESIAAATVRLHREIAAAAQQIFEEKSRAYLVNLAQIASDASKVRVP
jgi:hypothetical protein